MKNGYYMRDGVKIGQQMWQWNGDKKEPKGLRKVLEERGYDLGSGKQKLLKEDMMKLIDEELDFIEDKKIFQSLQVSKSINKCSKVILFPKYHCELNMMENIWMDTKNVFNVNQDFKSKTDKAMRDKINEIMDGIPIDRIRKYACNTIACCYGYEGGLVGQAVMVKIQDFKKLRKSHRRSSKTLAIE